MKKCEDFGETLGAWLDGELSRTEAEEVRLHVENCALCGEERRQLQLVNLWIKRGFEAASPPVDFEPFWRGVRQLIVEKPAWHEQLRNWAEATFTPPRLAWGVPAILLILIAALSINSLLPVWRSGAQRNNFAAVDSIDAHGRNVALLREDETKTTVIWLYQNQEGENEATANSPETSPSF